MTALQKLGEELIAEPRDRVKTRAYAGRRA